MSNSDSRLEDIRKMAQSAKAESAKAIWASEANTKVTDMLAESIKEHVSKCDVKNNLILLAVLGCLAFLGKDAYDRSTKADVIIPQGYELVKRD